MWLVLGEAPDRRYRCPKQDVVHRMLRCRCICGVERDVALFRLQQGATKSCGTCMFSRSARRSMLKSGDTAVRLKANQKIRTIWRLMKELPDKTSGSRTMRMVMCECQRGHPRSMPAAVFRGEAKRLPPCRSCSRDLRAFNRAMQTKA